MEFWAVDEWEREEVAADQLQQEPIKLLLKRSNRVHLAGLDRYCFQGGLAREELLFIVLLLCSLLRPQVLPLPLVLALQVAPQGFCASTWDREQYLNIIGWVSLQIVSDDKIQITLLILRRGALSNLIVYIWPRVPLTSRACTAHCHLVGPQSTSKWQPWNQTASQKTWFLKNWQSKTE